jgi:serine/threonine protein kinase
MSLPHPASASNEVLVAILNEIGASERLQVFLDDNLDDDALKTLSKLRPERIASIYGLPLDQAAAFIDRCLRLVPAAPTAFSPATDDTVIMRSLNMEKIRELGKGGFGTVYEARNLTDLHKVALKIVKDPLNATHAILEGQRLRRVQHKNIVLLHKVHDIGDGSCVLEMEVVSGGDLSKHLEACRRRANPRLPHDAVLRFSRQLLEALVYIHEDKKWLHGDIKPQNLLINCDPVPADGSPVDYSSAEIKLADFGMSKKLDQLSATSTLMLGTMAGVLTGTMLYLSPEALQGASNGCNYERSVLDDLWSACLVISEMDTGLSIQQIVKGPGSVNIDELLTKSSPELLPLLCSVLTVPSAAFRCNSAVELLSVLDSSLDPLFIWQCFDAASQKYVPVHPASFVFLERAFSANEALASLPLPPPLDLHFDIQALLSSPTALGFQTERRSGRKCRIRRVLKPSVLSSTQSIPVWQELVDGKEWLQCRPALCAKLDIDAKNPIVVLDTARYRRIVLESNSFDRVELPHPMKTEPHLASTHADDIAMLNRRVHDSLPEWDVTGLAQVINAALASKYTAYRHQVATRCNGNPNERMMFHYAEPAVMTKIWQEGEGHDPRLTKWAEVGKGAYFSKHPMYGYAYKYCLWPSPPSFAVKPEPPIGETMQFFASLVCLGNVADMGPGCETCPSPAWDAWKREPPVMDKPVRPPGMLLSADAAEKQHILDISQVKEAPRFHSVISTEGDLGTHPASTNKDASGRRICDIMHPRLRARARDWAEQCVLFETAASYPMFIVTLTKTRDGPMGVKQLIDAGCDAKSIKALGFTASHVKALGLTVREMLAHGWPVLDLKNADLNAQSLLAGGCSAADLKTAFFTASELKDCGCSVQQLMTAGFPLQELKACFGTALILSAGCSLSDMRSAGFTASELKAVGCNAQKLKQAGFSANELQDAGFDLAALGPALFEALALRTAGFTALQLQKAGYTPQQLCSGGFTIADLMTTGFDRKTIIAAGYSSAQLREAQFTALELQKAGYTPQQLWIGGFTVADLMTTDFDRKTIIAAGYSVNQLRKAGYTYDQLHTVIGIEDQLEQGGFFTCDEFFFFTTRFFFTFAPTHHPMIRILDMIFFIPMIL